MKGQNYQMSMEVALEAVNEVNPQEFYMKAMLENRSSSLFRQVLNLKEKTKIGNVGFEDPVLPFGCTWEGTNSNLGAKEMETEKLMIQTEICLSDIESSFIAQWMTPGTEGVDLPSQFRQHFFEELARAVSNSLEYMTWRGDKSLDPVTYGSLSCIDGLEKQLTLAAIPPAQKLSGAAPTVSTIIATLNSMYNKIPESYDDKSEEVLWFIPSGWAKLYKQAVAAASAEAYYTKNVPLDFLGIKLEVAKGMSANKSTISRKVNYIMLADLLSDQQNLKVIDQSNTTAVYTMRVTSTFKYGVNYLNDEEWVTFGIA